MRTSWKFTGNYPANTDQIFLLGYSTLLITAYSFAGAVTLTIVEWNGTTIIATDVVAVPPVGPPGTGVAIYDRVPKGTHLTITPDADSVLGFDATARW